MWHGLTKRQFSQNARPLQAAITQFWVQDMPIDKLKARKKLLTPIPAWSNKHHSTPRLWLTPVVDTTLFPKSNATLIFMVTLDQGQWPQDKCTKGATGQRPLRKISNAFEVFDKLLPGAMYKCNLAQSSLTYTPPQKKNQCALRGNEHVSAPPPCSETMLLDQLRRLAQNSWQKSSCPKGKRAPPCSSLPTQKTMCLPVKSFSWRNLMYKGPERGHWLPQLESRTLFGSPPGVNDGWHTELYC